MIDQLVIFERGGTILWSRNYDTIKGDPLSTLVRTVLLEDRLSLSEISFDNYTLKWTQDNQHGLFFVVLYQRQLPPAYANHLLQLVRDHFVNKEVTKGIDMCTVEYDDHFNEIFNNLLTVAERKAQLNSADAVVKTAKKKKRSGASKKKKNGQQQQIETIEEQVEDGEETSLSSEDVISKNREAFLRRQTRSGATKKNRSVKGSENSDTANSTLPITTTRKKIMRPGNKTKQEDLSALDFSEGKPENSDQVADEETQRFKEQYLEGDRNEAFDEILEESDEESDEESEENEEESSQKTGGIFNYFKGLAGMRSLTREDLKPVMDKFRDGLVGKNVAKDIADKLIESVMTSLEGQTMESMTSVSTMVKNALEEALTRILTPRQSTDLISEISAKKALNKGKQKQPYVITFCGVNGVGKSTSLAKTCFHLLNHGYKVMIAACDTFRAGAVEQLRTHVRCLGEGVQLFDKGYGKDAASVASDAIRKAKELGMDVVLIDTAGRMQDNEPLMKALAKLVQVNQPDRVLFVGEALVGNDAVDQLTKFNQALIDYSGHNNSNMRLIDGIVLTKFDTIDDKVGAAVSMVYTTGQPIVFIGIGQTYMDLRKLNTKALVKALLKM